MRTIKNYFPFWIILGVMSIMSGGGASSLALAKETPTEQASFQLPSVVITALKEGLTIEESGATVAHIDGQTIERLNAQTLQDTLTYEPGVQIDEGHGGKLDDIRIRGIGGDRVAILVDNIELPRGFSFGYFGFGEYLKMGRNYFDIDAMKSLDLVKGPLSTLYGGSALAGGVFMTTKDPLDFIKDEARFGGEAKLGYYSKNQGKQLSLTGAGLLTDDLSALLRFTYRKGNEMRNYHGKAVNPNQIGDERRYPNAEKNESYNLLSKLVYEPSNLHKFTLSYENFKDKNSTDMYSNLGMSDGFFTTGVIIFNRQQESIKYNNRRQLLSLRHDLENETPLFDYGFWQLHYQNTKAEQNLYEKRTIIFFPHAPPGAPFVRPSDDIVNAYTSKTLNQYRTSHYQSKTYGLSAEFNKFFTQNNGINHDFSYGISLKQSRFDNLRQGFTLSGGTPVSIIDTEFPTKSFPKSRVREEGLYFQDRLGFFEDKLELILGLRYDHYSLKPQKNDAIYNRGNPNVEGRAVGKSNQQWSKRVALLYHPSPDHTLFANYSEGFRAPPFEDVNAAFAMDPVKIKIIPNPQLNPERSKQYELGWNYATPTLNVALTGFYTDYKDFIESLYDLDRKDNQGFKLYQTTNFARSYIYGAELKARYLFTNPNDTQGRFGVNLSLAYAKGKDKDTKQPLDSVEPLTAVIGMDYQHSNNLYLALNWKLVAAKASRHISDNKKEGLDEKGFKQGGIQRLPGYGTVDLLAEYKPHKDITINAGIYNLFNKKHWTWGDFVAQSNITSGKIERSSRPGINVAFSIKFEF